MAKIVPASLWTRKDLKEFKDGLRASKENVVRIGSLATATVRGYYGVQHTAFVFVSLVFFCYITQAFFGDWSTAFKCVIIIQRNL